MKIHYVLQCQLANSKPSGAGRSPFSMVYGIISIRSTHAERAHRALQNPQVWC